MAKGVSAPRIATVVPLTAQAIRKVGHRYRRGGLDGALYEKARPGAAALLAQSFIQLLLEMAEDADNARPGK
jgi:transposase